VLTLSIGIIVIEEAITATSEIKGEVNIS